MDKRRTSCGSIGDSSAGLRVVSRKGAHQRHTTRGLLKDTSPETSDRDAAGHPLGFEMHNSIAHRQGAGSSTVSRHLRPPSPCSGLRLKPTLIHLGRASGAHSAHRAPDLFRRRRSIRHMHSGSAARACSERARPSLLNGRTCSIVSHQSRGRASRQTLCPGNTWCSLSFGSTLRLRSHRFRIFHWNKLEPQQLHRVLSSSVPGPFLVWSPSVVP